jgi:hypothetical protein
MDFNKGSMESQQIVGLLLPMQAEIYANRKAYHEEIMAMVVAYHERMMACLERRRQIQRRPNPIQE